MTDKITYPQHLKNMEEFEPYMEFLEDQTEMETAVKYLMEFPSVEYLGEEFDQHYRRAVQDQLEWFKENAIIKQTEAKEIVKKVEGYKYMEYKDEQ